MSGFTLLLAEDNYGDQKIVAEVLRDGKRDTNLQIVDNGDEALSYLLRNGKYLASTVPNLIVLDWNLPGKSGYEVLSEIKKNATLLHIPVVIFTGATVPNREKLTPDFYIVKPDGLAKYRKIILAIDEFGRSMLEYTDAREEHLRKLQRSVSE